MTSSSSMPEQEHGRSPPETVKMASDDEPQAQLPGLGHPATGRSDVATMVTTGGAGDEEEEVMGAEDPLDLVLIGSPWGVLLAPTPLSSVKQDDEVSAPPPCCPAAAKGAAKQCVQCGATETPQWRFQPMGQGALCNACRIRLRPAEALREKVHVPLPPPATATVVISESPADDDGWISKAWMEFDAYLLKVTPPSHRWEKSPSPAPAPAPEKTKQKRKRKPWRPGKSSKRCHHCNSASTPQWRMGPTGPSTLCNACGVRYRQGRLLQEYRPAAASPNFDPSEHACKHRKVVQLREEKKHRAIGQHQEPPQPGAGDAMEQHLPPPPAQAHAAAGGDELPTGEPISLDQLLLDAIDGPPETYGVGGDLQMGDPSSLDDEFLFDGPAAPPLIDDDDDKDLGD